ncbi:MAG: methyltransferase domain-containing protein [Pseudonocardia sp.]
MTDQVTASAAQQRARLVELLTANGSIRTDPVRRAFAEVARDHFVPRFQKSTRDPASSGHRWIDAAEQHDEWLRGVYRDEVLIVQTRPAPDLIDPNGGPTSSSSMPSVMAGMLEALDLRPGMRVLEIGTGTGYNTALLCHLAGAENVVSIELDPDLAAAARHALHKLDLHPAVRVGDGRAPLPREAPFDRIIVTASADHVPPDWITALADEGAIVVDLRGSLGGGLARLTKTGDDLVDGHFLGVDGAFMPLRARHDSPHRDDESWDRPFDVTNPAQGQTWTDPDLLTDPTFRLITQCHFGGKRLRGFLPDFESPTWSGRAVDGSWFSVDAEAHHPSGRRGVEQGGPQRLWDTVTAAREAWDQLDRPAITDLRIVAYDHTSLQHIECGHGDVTLRWPLPL